MVDRAFVDRPYPRIVRSLNRARWSGRSRLEAPARAEPVAPPAPRRQQCCGPWPPVLGSMHAASGSAGSVGVG